MERVAFLIEGTGERLGCLLNPDSLTLRRTAGIRPRRLTGGRLTGPGLTDDAMLYSGGGRTELELDLLFDIHLAGSTIQTEDVKDLTGPLWALAENRESRGVGERVGPAQVRFVWGKAWNLLGVVTAVAERLERFSATGAPQRSWLRLRLLRVDEPVTPITATQPMTPAPEAMAVEGIEVPAEHLTPVQAIGAGIPGGATEGLPEMAHRLYGDPAYWRLLASFNSLDDPRALSTEEPIQAPPKSLVENIA